MDQFRQVGEVLGAIKSLMVLKHDISINQKQCCLLLHVLDEAYETISDEIKQNLRLEEKNSKWEALEHPLRELHRIFRESELYIRHCLDVKDWWGKAMSLHQNKDCVEFHIHNLLCCFPIVIEAIETAGEISGRDQDDMQKRRLMLMKKYDGESNDPRIFQWKYGKQYLVPREICNVLGSAWREDRWVLLETVREKRSSAPATIPKHEQRLADLLLKKLTGSEPLQGKLLPAWILVGAKDYHVKRRLGAGGSHHKEIQWLGESFAMRNFFGEINDQLLNEISLVQSFSHPNIMQHLCGFYDEERKEGLLVMELMSKSLGSHIKEHCGQRKRLPFSLPVAVDIMLQIARGMEYLHSQKIYHGDLNQSTVLLKARHPTPEGYFHVKVTGFGLNSIKSCTARTHTNQNGEDPIIWYAPEVLAEQEQKGTGKCTSKYTPKSDVYSFGMLCFEILTGKIPFEEGHLQEDKIGRNIRAGERPLFPYTSPKYLVNLTRKCWQTEPTQRPSFSAICRILRYIKKCLVINPDHGQPESPPPLVDYCEIEAGYSKLFPGDGSLDLASVSQIPFQMFAYKLVEKEKTSGGSKDKVWDLAIGAPSLWGAASVFGDENGVVTEDPFFVAIDQRSVCSDVLERKPSGRIGADQRSVCSETPWRRNSPNTAADQRSLLSEFLWRKMDQRSVGSVTPERRFLSSTAADQRSVGSLGSVRKASTEPHSSEGSTPERKVMIPTAADPISDHLDTAEQKILPAPVIDEKPVCSKTAETKTSLTVASNEKSVGPKITTRRTLPTRAADQSCSETPKKKASDSDPSKITPGKVLPSTASESDLESINSERPKNKTSSTKSFDQHCSKTPKKKTLSRAVSDSDCSKSPLRKVLTPIVSDSDLESTYSERSKKKISSKKSTDQRSVRSENPDTKVLAKKRASVTKTSNSSGTQKGNSPRSSPVRTAHVHSRRSSPVWIGNGNSPGSSPMIRIASGQSPRSSPLNPSCVRCSRMDKECRAASRMSPCRRQRSHVSDSEMA